MTDPNDKHAEYELPFHCNEKHSEDEWNPKTEGKIADPKERHKDKLLDAYCDTHPGTPECKVFDD